MKLIIVLIVILLLLIFVPQKSGMVPEQPGRESEEITGGRTFATIQIDNNQFKFYK
jgi:hypothetical protein